MYASTDLGPTAAPNVNCFLSRRRLPVAGLGWQCACCWKIRKCRCAGSPGVYTASSSLAAQRKPGVEGFATGCSLDRSCMGTPAVLPTVAFRQPIARRTRLSVRCPCRLVCGIESWSKQAVCARCAKKFSFSPQAHDISRRLIDRGSIGPLFKHPASSTPISIPNNGGGGGISVV